ncbi:MAG: GPI anchored serine-threonine rich family protein [Gemmatimonadales bacterium]|nr:GPI anchored serine-threonine rich family protein [Gemmatimonadales bacterium]
MKKLVSVAVPVFLALFMLIQIGCNSDEDITDSVGPCGITMTRPLQGEVFLSGEEVKIYWDKSGLPDSVDIELLKNGQAVGEIVGSEENDGFYFWEAENMEQDNGSDFSVRVTALGEDGCSGESNMFSLTDVDGCSHEFLTPEANPDPLPDGYQPMELIADGDATYEITWFSSFTSGKVNLELMHYNDVIGYIAQAQPDSLQSYLWTIDSLHLGTEFGFKILISDTKVASCRTISPWFTIVDNDVCEIRILAPRDGVGGSEVTMYAGDIFNIEWSSTQVEGSLQIALNYQDEQIALIASNVDPALGSFEWTVAVLDWPEENTANYQIVINDDNNSIADCIGVSDAFLITN